MRWIVGSGGVIPSNYFAKNHIAKTRPNRSSHRTQLTVDDALKYLIEQNFCNPHQLVNDKRKLALRTDFFHELFEKTEVYLVNTTASPKESQQAIRTLLSLNK